MIRSPNHKKIPTPEECRVLLRYDAETGRLFWNRRPPELFSTKRSHAVWNALFAGKEALAAGDKHGYRIGTINSRMMKAHRVVYAIHHGVWPDVIDHINGDPSDNRIENLRSVEQAENMRNQKRRNDNTSSITGVWLEGNRWAAEIKVRGVKRWLGRFDTIEEAKAVRKRAEVEIGYHANHGRA